METKSRSDASAVLVTRGDVDLTEIAASLEGFDEIIIWNNQLEDDVGVYGRYCGIAQARNDIVYVQDDDCIVGGSVVDGIDALISCYKPGWITANMPVSRWDDYPDSCLVGWGAVFDRDLPEAAFSRFSDFDFGDETEAWLAGLGDPFFARTCDVAFTTLTPCKKIDLGFRHLPWAETPERMFKQPGHKAERDKMSELARQVRDG